MALPKARESRAWVRALGYDKTVMSKVRKAIITAAGRGTRQYPASSAVQKEMFPLVDRDGITKPVIQIIGEEALAAGVEEICIICQPGDEAEYGRFFRGLTEETLPAFKNKAWAIEQSERLKKLSGMLSFVPQHAPEGFGHAVWCAKEWAAGEPVLVLLGDHIYISESEAGCATQLTRVFDPAKHASLTAVQPVGPAQLDLVGVVQAEGTEAPGLYRALKIVEKPGRAKAEADLHTPGLARERWLGHFGMYVFSGEIFECLDHVVRHDLREKGEIQLTTAQDLLRTRTEKYYVLDTRGRRYDTGIPYGLMETQLALSLYSIHRRKIVEFLLHELARWPTGVAMPNGYE